MKWSTALPLVVVVCVAAATAVFLALQPTQTPEQTLPSTLRIGVQPSWHHVALFVMWEKGWIQKVLGVEPDVRLFATGPEEMEAFAAGALDVAYVGATPPLSIIAKGARAKIVTVANTEGSSIVVRPDLAYEGPQSLIGKAIGCYPPGSIQHTLLTKWLMDNGVDPGQVVMKYQGPADQLESLRVEAIHAAFVPDPHPYVAVLGGYGKIAVNSSEMWPHHPCCVVLMSEDFIAKNRDAAVKFIALHVIASEYASKPENREEVMSVLMRRLGIDREVAETFPGTTRLETDPRSREWLSGLDYMCRVHYDLGLTKDPEGRVVMLRASDVVDASLYEEALKLIPQIKAQLGLR